MKIELQHRGKHRDRNDSEQYDQTQQQATDREQLIEEMVRSLHDQTDHVAETLFNHQSVDYEGEQEIQSSLAELIRIISSNRVDILQSSIYQSDQIPDNKSISIEHASTLSHNAPYLDDHRHIDLTTDIITTNKEDQGLDPQQSLESSTTNHHQITDSQTANSKVPLRETPP